MAAKNAHAGQFKAVIFDLDGTLIDSLPYHFLSFKDLLSEHGIRVPDSYLRRLIGLPTEGILADLKRRYGFRENVRDLLEERRYHYFKFLGRRNIVFPGVKAAIRRLKSKCKIAIATGSSEVVFTHSTDKEFQKLFDTVVTINDVRKGKPCPEQLLLAARRLRVKPSDCAMVGDSVYDGMAARRAGMGFVGVARGFATRSELIRCGAIAVIDSVKDLHI
jgi:HAD superfamily hydrolase (TIGR01509 family)